MTVGGTGGPHTAPAEQGAGLARLVRSWRGRAQLTQEQLADRSGMSVRSIRTLEAGAGGRPRSSSLGRLAAALNLSETERTAMVAAARGTPAGCGGDDRADRPDRSASGASSPSSDAAPRQLPAPPPSFTGRVAELADLDQIPDATSVVIESIDGMAGVGKTALALHVAHQMAGHYPDGQLFLDLHGYTDGVAPVEPGDALERVLRTLGVPGDQIPHHLDDRAALYRSLLADRKVLVLLDNALSEAQVAPLLPGTPGCLVMVTSRRRLAGLELTRVVSLDVLPPGDAVALYSDAAGDGRTGGAAPETLAEVVEMCGRLPLALRIAAARLRSRPAWTTESLVDRLRDHRNRLAELDAGLSVGAALELSYQDLDPRVRRGYRLLALHPGALLDLYAAAALLDATVEETTSVIDQLVDAHLLQEPTVGRFRFHDLIREHARRTASREETEPDRRAATTRLLDHYRHAAAAAMDVAYPHERYRRPKVPPARTPIPDLPDPVRASTWLDGELSNIIAAARHAGDNGRAID